MVHADVLERPRPPAVDGQSALIAAMRRDWSSAYLIDVDLWGTWWAIRRDGRKAVSGRLPVVLLVAIIADFDARPVTREGIAEANKYLQERAAPGTPAFPAPADGETQGAALASGFM
jgi:hypothetical protein